ncbi:filamentous hemagglutinin N-terminal domain-containing protein [Providencia rettgeri]|uniref:two-partner secretion domain-containing protein n=1 Tax=Providencia rettgeri TaxID=587 RepID=UPI001EE6B9BE|nr:filamentous hemagglutinin N-terminal domain-containing protein [Providencia rettgeri]MCG5379095.1 filamentous hemagglutinin N-terminal domain-containing protein [Providencia rettgeri]
MNKKMQFIFLTNSFLSCLSFSSFSQADVSKAKLINIEAPLKNHISFNSFESLSSNDHGLIFNNDINDNNQLANKAAKLILAEVTGTEESKIKGVLGIKGQAANLIIANPNGISWADGSISNINSLSLIAGKLEKQYVKNKETKQLEAKALDEYSQLKFSVSPARQINISQQHASPLQLSKLNVFADRIKLQNALNITAAVQNYLSTSGSASISPREAVIHSGSKFKTDTPYSQGSHLELGENTKLLGRLISFESHQYQCKDSFLCPQNTIDIKGLIQTMNFSLHGDSDFVMHGTGKIQIGKNQQVLVAQ